MQMGAAQTNSGTEGGAVREIAPRPPESMEKVVLFLLPPLAVVGPWLPIIPIRGFNLFAFRAVVLAAVVLPLLLAPALGWLRNGVVLLYGAVGALWVGWGLLAAFWAPDPVAAVVNAMGAAFGFLTALALVNLRGNTTVGIRWLLRGWVAGAAVAGLVAVWELTTGGHLPGTWVSDVPAYALRFIAVSTFDNPNNYGAFLLLVTAILLHMLERAQRLRTRLALVGLVTVSAALCVLTTSRIAVGGIGMLLLLYLIWGARNRLAAAGVGLAIVGGYYAALEMTGVTQLVSPSVLLQSLTAEESNLIRLNLTLSGLQMVVSSYGLGVGGGNFNYLVENGKAGYWTGAITDPHNWWIEVLSQYGVLVFGAYVAFFAYTGVQAASAMRRQSAQHSRGILVFIAAFAISGLAGSSYMMQTTNWLFTATILMLVSQRDVGEVST